MTKNCIHPTKHKNRWLTAVWFTLRLVPVWQRIINCFCGSQVTKASLDDCLTMMQVKVIQGHDDIRARSRTLSMTFPTYGETALTRGDLKNKNIEKSNWLSFLWLIHVNLRLIQVYPNIYLALNVPAHRFKLTFYLFLRSLTLKNLHNSKQYTITPNPPFTRELVYL